MTPASRDRVWATTVVVRCSVVASSSTARRSCPARRPVAVARRGGVAQYRGGVAGGVRGQIGELAGEPARDGLVLVAGLRLAQPQPGVDLPGAAAGVWGSETRLDLVGCVLVPECCLAPFQ